MNINMKKYSLLLLIFSFIFSMSSCLFLEEDVFDTPPAQRLNEAMDKAEKTLIASEYGWEMLYFPADNEDPFLYKKKDGHLFLMKFNESGDVHVGTAYEKYNSGLFGIETGSWDVIGDNGPVLTFNTYIANFSIFADPVDPGLQQGEMPNGIGIGGDYEFIIMSVSDSEIELRGKKRGTRIVMRPIDSPMEEWSEYYDSVENLRTSYFFNPSPYLLFTDADSTWTFEDGFQKYFRVKNTTASLYTVDPVYFIMTPNGFRLGQPFELYSADPTKRNLMLEFHFNENKTKFVEVSNPEIELYPQSPISYLSRKDMVSDYLGNKSNLSGNLLQAFTGLAAEFATTYANNANWRTLEAIGFRKIDQEFALLVRTSGYTSAFDIPFKIDEAKNTLEIPAFDVNNMVFDDFGASLVYNGNDRYPAIASIKTMLKAIQGTYTLSVEDADVLTLNTIKYTRVGSITDYLNITRFR